MAVIAFTEDLPDAAWVVAGWAFRQVLSDVRRLHPDDVELSEVFERAEAVGYLRLGFFQVELAAKLESALKDTAQAILAGRIRSGLAERFKDEQITDEYFKGLRMLLDAVRAAEESRP